MQYATYFYMPVRLQNLWFIYEDTSVALFFMDADDPHSGGSRIRYRFWCGHGS